VLLVALARGSLHRGGEQVFRGGGMLAAGEELFCEIKLLDPAVRELVGAS
jgi:hypothetical protein